MSRATRNLITVLRPSTEENKLRLETYKKIESPRTKDQAWKRDKDSTILKAKAKKHIIEALNAEKPVVNIVNDSRINFKKNSTEITQARDTLEDAFNVSIEEKKDNPKLKNKHKNQALFLIHSPTIVAANASQIEARINSETSDENKFTSVKEFFFEKPENYDLIRTYDDIKEEHLFREEAAKETEGEVNEENKTSSKKIPVLIYPEVKFLDRGKNEDYLDWNLRETFTNPDENKSKKVIDQIGTDTKVNNDFLNHLNKIFKL
ncbi:MAG: hypothetical protein HRT47_04460 [Candidatus Caenarcaniphilales bacterium]|nr:hypothetical protein [Candidatus Caenarcaniphilales bacterium]